jgi:hypothetical protein
LRLSSRWKGGVGHSHFTIGLPCRNQESSGPLRNLIRVMSSCALSTCCLGEWVSSSCQLFGLLAHSDCLESVLPIVGVCSVVVVGVWVYAFMCLVWHTIEILVTGCQGRCVGIVDVFLSL